MTFRDLYPEEKLMCAVFGWHGEEYDHFLEDSGRQVVREVLLKFEHDHKESTLSLGRGAQILRLRFGIIDGHCHTLQEVGRDFKVTRERIRQIEGRTLRIIRHPSWSRFLKPCAPLYMFAKS